jgi:small subunit ribosomal protein S20
MPLLENAKKKLRQDKKRTARNNKVKKTYKSLIKVAKVEKTLETIGKAFSAIDKAAKQNLIHKNKAARLKSSISKTA